jgi:hypothetical protein
MEVTSAVESKLKNGGESVILSPSYSLLTRSQYIHIYKIFKRVCFDTQKGFLSPYDLRYLGCGFTK